MSTPITSVIYTNHPSGNGRVYPKEVFEKALEEYTHKILIEERTKKLKKLNEKIKDINRIGQTTQ